MKRQDLVDGSKKVQERYFEGDNITSGLMERTGKRIRGLLQKIDSMGITVSGKFYSIQNVRNLFIYDGRDDPNGDIYVEVIK